MYVCRQGQERSMMVNWRAKFAAIDSFTSQVCRSMKAGTESLARLVDGLSAKYTFFFLVVRMEVN